MKTARQFWIAFLILSALLPAGIRAQDPVLIREVVSREVSIFVGQEPPLPPPLLETTALLEAGFEMPDAGDYLYWGNMTPAERTASDWSAIGNSWAGPAWVRNTGIWQFGPIPEGSQALALQGDASISRSVSFPVAGDYHLTWQAASRGGQVNPYVIRVDGVAVSATFSTNVASWKPQSVSFHIPVPGEKMLSFAALSPGADLSVGIDAIRLNRILGPGVRPVSGIREISSREVSVQVENGVPDREVVSREYDILVDAPGAPPAVNEVTVTLSPTAESMTLDWAASNPWAVRDIQWFDIYLSDSGPITDVTGLTAYRRVGGSVTQATLDGLTAFTDHYFAIVAVDGQGNRLTTVLGKAAYALMPQVVSREVSLFVGQEPEPPYKQVVSREYDICVDAPGAPPAIDNVVVSLNAAGDTATLDWSSYNQWAVKDVQRFDIYLSDTGAFSDVTGMTPFASIGGGATGITLSGLTPQTDHYFAVVPVDALGNRIPQVNYSAGYVLMPQVVSREVSLFIGQEPEPPYREVVSREVSVVVSDGTTPAPVTGIDSGFSAFTSASSFGAIDLDWTSYNELLQKDVSRYRVYLSDTYFESVAGMEPHSYVQTGRQTATIDGFPSAAIRYVAVVAEDASGNFNPVVRAHSVQASYLPRFRFFDDTFEVVEGQVADIAVELEGPLLSARYLLDPDSARPFDGHQGDYLDVPEPLRFAINPETNRWEANLQIPIVRDNVAESNEEFTVLIVNPVEGSTAVVASVRVKILEEFPAHVPPSRRQIAVWHPESRTLPLVASTGGASVAVELDPVVPGAKWRLVGEPFWREPGAANPVESLSPGMHRVEYLPVLGFGQPIYPPRIFGQPGSGGPDPRTALIRNDDQHVFETTYPAVDSTSGTLQVVLRPASQAVAADPAQRLQWRLVGEHAWRNSGDGAVLPPGKHLVEFKSGVTGFHEPTPRTAIVNAGGVASLLESYQPAADSGEVAPLSVLPFTAAAGEASVQSSPHQFAGQLETSQGYGSGVAVTAHTVLTAARVVFDPDTLASATGIAWSHQRHADYGQDVQDPHNPGVKYPRGYKLLTSYVSQMESEEGNLLPGDAPSDQKDVAVLFFTTENGDHDTARTGFSGFLADFSPVARPNPWLTGAGQKFLCGYPLGGIATGHQGLMHATAPADLALVHAGGSLYRCEGLEGSPGMEGAPLFVTHPNGNAYPAGVFLGQNRGAVFRALDQQVASIIYLAEWEALVIILKTRSFGGGEYEPRWSGDDEIKSFLYVDFQPEEGRWRLIDPENENLFSDWYAPGVRLPIQPGAYLIEYSGLNGFRSPDRRMVLASSGLTAVTTDVAYRRNYFDWASSRFAPEAPEAGPDMRINDLPNLIAFAFGLEPGSSQRMVARPEEGLPGLPRVLIDPSTNPPTIRVDFMKRNATITPDLDYVIEFADSPAGPWFDAPTDSLVSPVDSEWDRVSLESAPVSEAGRKFVRVRVEQITEP